MSLQFEPKKSKWWYARILVNGRRINRNLGVEVRGIPPPSLTQSGDLAFERSRAKAQATMEQLQLDIQKRKSSEELVQTLHEIRTGRRIRSIALPDVALRWQALPRRRPLNKRYVTQVEGWMKRFIAYLNDRYPSAKEMADVQTEMAQDFFRSEQERGVAPKTYNNSLISLRSCFTALRKAGGLVENPFDGIPTREEETIFRKPFSIEDLALIVEAAKSDPFIEPIIITAICTALRRGDCCTLRKTAVDLPGRFISVKTSKTNELVQIPIFPLLYQVLSKIEPNDSPYVFPQQEMKYQLNPDQITDRVRRVMQTAGFFDPEDAPIETQGIKSRGEIHQARPNGLRKASVRDFHSFRVTWVTLALSAGVPLEIVQKVTGHRTANIVMKHYFQPGREEFRRTLACKLPALIGGSPQPIALEPDELMAKLDAMQAGNWNQIRDELLSRLRGGAIKTVDVPSTPTPANSIMASAA